MSKTTGTTTLRTDRLIWRAARVEDAEALHAVFGDGDTMRYWSTGPDVTRSETEERIRRMAEAAIHPLGYGVIELDGMAIGTAGLHHGTEIGFILNRSYWRQGLMREAMQAIIPHLFATRDVLHLTADADPENRASVSTLTALGFVVSGYARDTYHVDGRWSHSVYFHLPRP